MAPVFISYRTKDERYLARIVFDRLSDHFGRANVFLAATSIKPGDKFPSVIWGQLRDARVLLAVIGPQWLTAQSMDGLDIGDPDDWVRREIAEAIRAEKKIIPILVDEATLPHSKDLPPDLRPLVDLQALSISDKSLDDDIKRLANELESWIGGQRKAPPSDDDARLDRAARLLAGTLHSSWNEEMAMRGLRSPRPLVVRWAITDLPVAVPPWSGLDNDSQPGRTVPLPRSGTVGDMAAAVRMLPGQQLVVLGAAGSGKTVAANMLTLDLLESSESVKPVPVPVLMASWRPDIQHPYRWLANRLAEDFSFLTRDDALRLITTGRVMPVLDGLDEMPEALRPAAIEELDRATGGRPLVLTCRTSEYQEAVAKSGHVLTSAVVVEFEPVGLDDAVAFLVATAAAARWRPVLAGLPADPNAPLTRALASPLAVSLARTVYTSPETTPSELLDVGRFPDRESVERHLLDGLIPAVYRKHPRLSEGRQARTCDPTLDQARRWLTFLACHLDHLRTTELAWWQLSHALSPLQAGTSAGILGALTVGLTVAVALTIASAPLNGLVFELTFGLFVGLASSLSVRPAINSPSERPSRLSTLLRPRISGRVAGLALIVGFSGALVFGSQRYGAGAEPEVVIVISLLVLLLAILLFIFLFGLAAPREPDREVSPVVVLRLDRKARLVVGLLALLIIGFPFSLWVNPAFGLGGGLAVGIAYVSSGAYGRFTQVRIMLACQRRLPLRLMTFLADAHDRDVLRQVGSVYQFRHRRLQEWLVSQAGADRD